MPQLGTRGLLEGESILLRLLHGEESRESSEDLRPIEGLMWTVVLEVCEVLDVLVSLQIVVSMHLLLFLLDLPLLGVDALLQAACTESIQLLTQDIELLLRFGLLAVLLPLVSLKLRQVFLTLHRALLVASDVVLDLPLLPFCRGEVLLRTLDVLAQSDGLVFDRATLLKYAQVLLDFAKLLHLLL